MTVHLMVHAASSGPSIITCAPRLSLHTQKVSLQEKKWRCFTILLSEWRWFLDTVCHSCPLVPGCSQVMSDDGGVRIDSSAHSFSGAGRTDQRRAFNKLLLITWCGHAITQLVAPWQHNYWARPAAGNTQDRGHSGGQWQGCSPLLWTRYHHCLVQKLCLRSGSSENKMLKK